MVGGSTGSEGREPVAFVGGWRGGDWLGIRFYLRHSSFFSSLLYLNPC